MQHILIVKLGSTLPDLAMRRGDFEDWVRAGLDVGPDRTALVDPVVGEALPDSRRFAGVVVTGSHAMVTDRADWSERTAAWLRDVVEAEVPLLAICYGHQLLAHATGGTVGNNPAGREFGTVAVRLDEASRTDPLFSTLPERFDVQVCHTQSALSLPPGAQLLASSAREPHQAYRLGRYAWGVQFHPEFDVEVTRTYIRQRAADLRSEGQDPDKLAAGVREAPHGTAVLGSFGRLVRGGAIL
ncbi:MAG TPA: glutamine amidotransferase [Thermoguttaceae bacterium]|nr:glutamine amidotransferase [Thermoguttaceae bacterium]